ncbi:agamous-like MADS-box protein AGL53 [Humulus lupulus]|uniref:agamous-like MADS-box protein AGL53 n=1 Tax=Humulus lupulus TaxID=3486 RepID=UPI002B400A3C|nr:agamous-like MADS-box protein AGL53 [Humulus lupulus]
MDTKEVFERRKFTLKKKANELTELCNSEVCLVCYDPNSNVEVWPEDPAKAHSIITKYYSRLESCNDKKRKASEVNLSHVLEKKMKKLEEQILEVKIQALDEILDIVKGKEQLLLQTQTQLQNDQFEVEEEHYHTLPPLPPQKCVPLLSEDPYNAMELLSTENQLLVSDNQSQFDGQSQEFYYDQEYHNLKPFDQLYGINNDLKDSYMAKNQSQFNCQTQEFHDQEYHASPPFEQLYGINDDSGHSSLDEYIGYFDGQTQELYDQEHHVLQHPSDQFYGISNDSEYSSVIYSDNAHQQLINTNEGRIDPAMLHSLAATGYYTLDDQFHSQMFIEPTEALEINFP